MKNRWMLLLLALPFFFISACDNIEPADDGNPETEENLAANMISEADLTTREEAILTTLANQSFVFDYNVDEEYKKASVWVEKYEFGELVDEQVTSLTTTVEENGSIIFAISEAMGDQKESTFHTSIASNGSTGSSVNLQIIAEGGLEGMSILWGSTLAEDQPITDGMVLGSIIYASTDNGISSPSSRFYQNVDENLDEIAEYDVVYLLRSKFEK